jgi:hypothetical protein
MLYSECFDRERFTTINLSLMPEFNEDLDKAESLV